MFSDSKHLNRVEKILIVVFVNSANPRVFTVHMTSDVIFGVDFYDVE